MHYTVLGRTGLRVSRMGLGCGGHSRLGLARGGTEADAEAVVRAALDLGVNFIDTAEMYGTEVVVGRGVAGRDRGDVVLSTKLSVTYAGHRCTPADFRKRAEGCLTRLNTEYVDVLHLHGVSAGDYEYGRDVLLPEIGRLREAGKVRWAGITEAFGPDPTHEMMSEAVRDDCWDVVMVGFNLINPSARERLMPSIRRANAGTLCMFAVRRALSRPDALRELIDQLVARREIDPALLDGEAPLAFLTARDVASGLTDAAYRFCLHEPGMDVILSGTGSIDHLRENARSLEGRPLPAATLARLREIFGRVDSVSGN